MDIASRRFRLLAARIVTSILFAGGSAMAEDGAPLTRFEPACAAHVETAEDARRCWTPRTGLLSGGYLALDLGVSNLRPSVASRIGAGSAFAFRARIGLEFWDHVVIGTGLGFLEFSDEHPTSEMVVDCVRDQFGNETCDSGAHSESSKIRGVPALVEVAYQHRFRPARAVSLVPALYAGYQFSRPLERGVGCANCPSTVLDASARGAYLAPFVRITLLSMFALFVRSDWYVTGDLVHQTSVGVEIGRP